MAREWTPEDLVGEAITIVRHEYRDLLNDDDARDAIRDEILVSCQADIEIARMDDTPPCLAAMSRVEDAIRDACERRMEVVQ